MSRCFPFPPPGYEKKARSDEADILKKEKQKEKKHNKEKKDKEKRESKEKKKDRSDEKHREKKEKKEKHRDKKEKKDRDKDKDKSGNSDEKRIPGNLGGPDGGKSSNENKFPGKYDALSGEKVIQKEKEKGKDRNSISGEKKFAGQFSGYSEEKLSQNSFQAGNSKDPKFMQDLGRRIRDEDRETGNKLVEKFSVRDTKRDEGMVRMFTNATGTLDEGMEKKKYKKGVDRKPDVQSIKDEARFSGSTMVQNPAGMVQTRVYGVPRPVEKDLERTLGKEKTKEKEGDEKRGDKRKDKDREKKARGKDKDRDKAKKKEEKAKIKSQHKNAGKDTLKGSNKDDLIVGALNKQTLHPPAESDKGIIEQNVRKRKDVETNGFFHDIDAKPNKLPRPTSSSHPLKENNKWPEVTSSSHSLTRNGQILESHQTSAPHTSERQGAANNIIKADKKEVKVNGIIASEALPLPPAKPTTAQIDQIPEVSSRPPHPDSKYLSQVLSVPKMEGWCHFDDQEWLLHNSNSKSKKPKVGCSGEDETPQVWAEAVRIESADVCALPYVIPY